MNRLSDRLSAIASLVPEGARIADIGTDHGYLAIRLALTASPVSVLATDVRRGPLESARRHIAEAGLENVIRLRLCDGLAAVSPEEADVIVIAGMGGETIRGILDRAPWALRDGRLLILEPQSKQEELRRWLYDNGCGIREEHLAEEAGKIYPILLAGGAPEREPSPTEFFIGVWQEEKHDALFRRYLQTQITRLERERQGLLCTQDEEKRKRLPELTALIAGLRTMEGGE